VCVCVCMYIPPSMVLQPLLGPGLPHMTSPFLSVFRLWYACVCVCVYIYVNNFQIWLCEVLESYSVSVYTRSATLLLYHTSNTICNGAGIKKKLKPMHKYWQWSILQFCNINKKPNHNVCVCACMHVFCVCVHTYIHTYTVFLKTCLPALSHIQ